MTAAAQLRLEQKLRKRAANMIAGWLEDRIADSVQAGQLRCAISCAMAGAPSSDGGYWIAYSRERLNAEFSAILPSVWQALAAQEAYFSQA